MGGSMDSRVRKDDGTMCLNGGSGRLTAKQNARCSTLRDEAVAPARDPSRRGRRSYQDLEMGIIPVGAVAWPRSRMHGTPTLRDEAVDSTRDPSRRGRRSYQDLEIGIIPVGAVAWPRSRMHGAQPLPGGAVALTQPLPGGAAGPTRVMIEHMVPW